MLRLPSNIKPTSTDSNNNESLGASVEIESHDPREVSLLSSVSKPHSANLIEESERNMRTSDNPKAFL